MAALLTPVSMSCQLELNNSTTAKKTTKTYSDCAVDATGDEVLAFVDAISPCFNSDITVQDQYMIDKQKVTESV